MLRNAGTCAYRAENLLVVENEVDNDNKINDQTPAVPVIAAITKFSRIGRNEINIYRLHATRSFVDSWKCNGEQLRKLR